MINVKCLECGQEFEKLTLLRRHVKFHKINYKEYVLKWHHAGVPPTCKCGCGKETTWQVGDCYYATYVHGHRAFGQVKSEETRRKIGEKNSKRMKKYYADHPDIANDRGKKMNAARTPEIEVRRISKTKEAYEKMTPERKLIFSLHAKKLWNEQREMMIDASHRGGKTFHDRFDRGEFDFTQRNEKLSKSITDLYLNGGFAWSRGKYVSSKSRRIYHYRSSWERLYMERLDADPDVVDWEYEFTSILYELNGVSRRYVPDFHVIKKSTGHELVEVKPTSLRSTGMNCAKQEAAIKYCAELGWKYIAWEPNDD